jgi:hypothetical protein
MERLPTLVITQEIVVKFERAAFLCNHYCVIQYTCRKYSCGLQKLGYVLYQLINLAQKRTNMHYLNAGGTPE